MELEMQIDELREEASDIGLFFPMHYDTDALNHETQLHGHTVGNRSVLLMQPALDAAENGGPSEETVRRYENAVREKAYGIVVIEPTGISADAREFDRELAISEENAASFQALIDAVKAASEEAHGFAPLVIALLNHAGHHALKPAALDISASLPHDVPLLKDEELNALLITCAILQNPQRRQVLTESRSMLLTEVSSVKVLLHFTVTANSAAISMTEPVSCAIAILQ